MNGYVPKRWDLHSSKFGKYYSDQVISDGPTISDRLDLREVLIDDSDIANTRED